MQDERPLNAEERELAEAMAGLRPTRPGLTRDGILLETYRRAGRRQAWLWRGVAAALAAGLVLSIVLRPPPKTVEKVVYVPTVPASDAAPVASATSPPRTYEPAPPTSEHYLALRHDVLAWGMSGLPRTTTPRPTAPTPAAAPMVAPGEPGTLYDLLKPFGIGGRS